MYLQPHWEGCGWELGGTFNDKRIITITHQWCECQLQSHNKQSTFCFIFIHCIILTIQGMKIRGSLPPLARSGCKMPLHIMALNYDWWEIYCTKFTSSAWICKSLQSSLCWDTSHHPHIGLSGVFLHRLTDSRGAHKFISMPDHHVEQAPTPF